MPDSALTETQQLFLLKLAREAINLFLETGKHLSKNTEDTWLKAKRGAFVTLKLQKKLRGCIGYPLPHDPLYNTVIDSAIMAASKDSRFQTLTKDELQEIKIEISVLSLPRNIKNISDIEIGKHGIIISQDLNKGLLLPQVPVEWNWDLETYLRHGCLKAGLKENAWKKNATIQIFTAQVFSE